MEVEKALSGVGGGGDGDSGLGDRMFGRLLEWLNDHETDVFFCATCNDISRIVESNPEFIRAGRFDGMFFFDTPRKKERETIWNIYLQRYGHTEDSYDMSELLDASNTWTGAEIESCCRLSAILKESIMQSATTVVPVAKTAEETLKSLRHWASGRCRSVRLPKLYQAEGDGSGEKTRTSPKRKTVKRRKVSRTS